MKNLITSLCLIAACAAAAPAFSAITSVSFQTSLTIVDSCRIDAGHGAPTVACAAASQSQVAAAPADTVGQGAAGWIVTF